MKHAEHKAKSASAPTTGFLPTLRCLLHLKGTGASSPQRPCVALGMKISAVLSVVIVAMAISSTTALAAAPEVVSEFTSPPAKAAEEARLEAAINPENEATKCDFQYGETVVTEHEVACTEPGETAEGEEQRAAVTVTGLAANTAYHWRIVLENASGKSEGGEEEVTTVPVPHTEAPSAISSTTATFNGTLAPLNATVVPTEYFFYYNVGEEFICTNERATGGEGAGTGSGAPKSVSSEVSELEAHQKYTVCLVSQNQYGGEEEPLAPVHFETLPAPPKIDGESASANSTEATLSAQVNPNNENTKYVFEYSTTESAGALTGTITTLTGASELEGGSDQTAEAATGAVLSAGTTYYYRVLAENEQSETEPHPAEGEVQSFTTPPAPSTEPVTAIATSTATFNGQLTLDATATQYHFDYKLGSECTGESETPSAEAGTGSSSTAVSTPVTGLQPGRLYSVCLVTSNASGSQVGPAVSFKTLPETYVTDVGSSSATLHAVLDPEGAATVYRFQYGTSSSYGAETEQASAGAGSKPLSFEVHIQGLAPNTVYHYRVIGAAGGVAFEGADATFATQPEGSEFVLPDGRAWELVSPPNKYGGSLEAITHEGGVIQASEDGSAITYVSVNPVVGEPLGNRALEDTQLLSRRGATGWSTEDIATPHDEVSVLKLGEPAEYKFFSPDLSLGLVEPKGETPLPPLPEGAEKTIYLRNDNDCAATPTETIPATCYLALATAENVEVPGSKLDLREGERPEFDNVIFQGASPDLSHVVFSDFEPLTKNAVKGEPSLYEWAGGRLSLVSILPDGKPANEAGGGISELGGGEHNVVRHAISTNGSQVIWHVDGHLYLRDMTRGETVQLDAPEPGGEGGGEAVFQTASSDGRRVFFTDKARLTSDSSASKEERASDLYVFEVTSGEGERLAGRLTDVSVDPNFAETGERAAVQGEIIGASEDGRYVYFVANGLLGDAAEHGASEGDCEPTRPPGETCNLYVEHFDGSGWEPPKFIATLSSEDYPDWSADKKYLTGLTGRVSPDGRWLAFMSDRSLTGYDNADVNSGVPDEEVYLFDAATGKLACASCNPAGQRPEGVFEAEEGSPERLPKLLVDQREIWPDRWLAGSVPGWTSNSLFTSLYQSRYLSNNGRLFFDSPDPLVSADVNHKEDVYEYEPADVGDCQAGVAGASETYEPGTGACVGLISSGTSSQESAFLDASATGAANGEGAEGGGDVFFLTASELASQDDDQAFDIYDAHECTASSPCVSPLASTAPPACTTADSCRAAPAPAPSIYGAPASATFNGPGDLTPVPLVAVKPKVETKAEKLAKALKACRKDRRKAKRRKCEKTARRTYGAKASAKKSSTARRANSERRTK